MMTIADARTLITNALATVDNMNVLIKAGMQTSVFPCVYVAPPILDWTTYDNSAPDDATFQIYLILAADDYVLEKLDDVLNDVIAALWTVDNAVVSRGIPATYPMGATQMPAYVLTCEVSL